MLTIARSDGPTHPRKLSDLVWTKILILSGAPISLPLHIVLRPETQLRLPSTKCKPSTMDKLHISLEFISTHTIHETDIFTYIYCSWFIYGFHVGKYTEIPWILWETSTPIIPCCTCGKKVLRIYTTTATPVVQSTGPKMRRSKLELLNPFRLASQSWDFGGQKLYPTWYIRCIKGVDYSIPRVLPTIFPIDISGQFIVNP